MRSQSPLSRILLFTCLVLLCACNKQEPVRLGFIGGLTGKVADLGVAGRNGVQLAIEQRNAAGGINGHPVELIVRDDEQNPDTARRVAGELIRENIELIIGPMTSSIAMAVLPQINASKSILLSPTVTTTELSGKDDNFLRVIGATTSYAAKNARFLFEKRGVRTVAVIYDINNASYTESWLTNFRAAFTSLGGKIVLIKKYPSNKDTVFQPLVVDLLAAKADSVLIISNAVDSAMICQQIHKIAPGQRIAMSEWASTERFIELAGTAAEGVVVSQFLDRNDTSQRFRDFITAYRSRFNQDPGFAGVAGYDAALVALDAITLCSKGASLKDTIITKKSFPGLQQPQNFDRFGDASRKTFVSVIKGNQYSTAE
ncbi:MAG: ABC transporter substrate-binding protein [Desulfuromonadaceae bacterium]|nr:ABC transporter substrate-binding protein [Desulfuromonadaceae bacterium]